MSEIVWNLFGVLLAIVAGLSIAAIGIAAFLFFWYALSDD